MLARPSGGAGGSLRVPSESASTGGCIRVGLQIGSQKPSRRPPSMPLGTVEPMGPSQKAPGDRSVTHEDRVRTAYGGKTPFGASAAALSTDRPRATKRCSMHPR